jgi:hypothetical protein
MLIDNGSQLYLLFQNGHLSSRGSAELELAWLSRSYEAAAAAEAALRYQSSARQGSIFFLTLLEGNVSSSLHCIIRRGGMTHLYYICFIRRGGMALYPSKERKRIAPLF